MTERLLPPCRCHECRAWNEDEAGDGPRICPRCDGAGRLYLPDNEHPATEIVHGETCRRCDGTGELTP